MDWETLLLNIYNKTKLRLYINLLKSGKKQTHLNLPVEDAFHKYTQEFKRLKMLNMDKIILLQKL